MSADGPGYIVGPMSAATVTFNRAHVVTLPNGDRLTIPAGSTVVEVAPPAPVEHDPAFLAWAKNDAENDHRRAELQMEQHQLRRIHAAAKCATSSTGEVGFNAYGGAGPNPWMTFNGADMPRWPDLGETPTGLVTRARWAAAANAEIAVFLANHGCEIQSKGLMLPEQVVKIGGAALPIAARMSISWKGETRPDMEGLAQALAAELAHFPERPVSE